eukprot:1270606-Lingulodinium_polyedra.AAC.1
MEQQEPAQGPGAGEGSSQPAEPTLPVVQLNPEFEPEGLDGEELQAAVARHAAMLARSKRHQECCREELLLRTELVSYDKEEKQRREGAKRRKVDTEGQTQDGMELDGDALEAQAALGGAAEGGTSGSSAPPAAE